MAAEKITANVAVEKFVHNALRDLAHQLWNDHGICVQHVQFSWREMSSMGKTDMAVTDVEAQTRTKG